MVRSVARAVAAIAVVMAMVASLVSAAAAFKPYTHTKTGDSVIADAADGTVTINGTDYPVSAQVSAALRDWPEFFRAGTIGPDGFPDLTYGQSIIHPEGTGLWLRHLYDAAWRAQGDPSYTGSQKSQILAFTYGYLMHAAGDLWAHTIVNDFSEGTFPGVGDILTDADMAAIALRHIIVEGYIGDATSGYDGNHEDRTRLPDGDWSEDATDAIDLPTAAEFGGVKRFLYENLVDPHAPTPTTDRGPMIDYFVDLRASLAGAVDDWDPDPIGDLVSAWESAKFRYDQLNDELVEFEALVAQWDACSGLACIGIGAQILLKVAEIGIDTVGLTVEAGIDLFRGAVAAAGNTVALAADEVFDAYLVAWIDDIDTGLENWAELGRASTVALFDPQARRNLQNAECGDEGDDETSTNRRLCEEGIGAVDVLFDQADPFINQHLLSMLGAPDAVGGLRQALQDLADDLDALLAPLGIAFNPLEELNAELKELAKQLLLDFIETAFGVDVETLRLLLTKPASWLNVTTIDIDLPLLGTVTIAELFRPTDHGRLDTYLHLPADHHVPDTPPWAGFPVAGSRLAESALFDQDLFAAYANTVTLGKLLLLDGATLDLVLSNELGLPYEHYGDIPGANVMLTPFPVPGTSNQQWLASIDADHGWRVDGRPVFPAPSGGEGNFPLWESCVLRGTFRSLFADWENGSDDFPDLGDTPTVDPNDPAAPEADLLVAGTTYHSGSGWYLAGDATLTVDASDDYWPADRIDVDVTVTDSTPTTTNTTLADGGAVALGPAAEGPVTVTVAATDPCRSQAPVTSSYVLDRSGPRITITSPAPDATFDTDDLSGIAWSADDGTHGSGVDPGAASASLDGSPISGPHPLDMFLLDPGTHSYEITEADNLGNTTTEHGSFVVRATAESLLANVERAHGEGLIANHGIYQSLHQQLTAARAAHDRGDHATEHNLLTAFVNHLAAQAGKKVDAVTADRFIAYALDLIAAGG